MPLLSCKLIGLLRPSDNSLSNETVTKLNLILLARLFFLFSFLTIEYIEVKNICIYCMWDCGQVK